MPFSYDQRIARAIKLSADYPAAREILQFYSELTRFQKRIFEDVSARSETDVGALAAYFPELMDLLRRIAPGELTESAAKFSDTAELQDLLRECWNGDWPADWFFGRALAQPFAESLAARGRIDPQSLKGTCPFCSGGAGVAVLRGEGDGGKRSLVCSLCSTEWQFRRVLCPNCGEEDKEKLPVYIASEFEHVRVEACDTCKTFIKAVDLTKNGHAIPVVDEIATVPLSIWAEEHGYSKLWPNLLSM
jgi:FdhE protein